MQHARLPWIPVMMLTIVVLIQPLSFFGGSSDEIEASSPKELDRIGFRGGTIVVRKIQYSPVEKGYVSIRVEPSITSEENLSAYIESRTNALNKLLNSVSSDSVIQANVILKIPMKPEDFIGLYETSLIKFSDYATVLTHKTTGVKTVEFFCHQTSGTEFTKDLMPINESFKLEGVIGAEAIIKAEEARLLQSDSRVLLIDPFGDPVVQEIADKYRSMGFYVEGPAPEFRDTVNQYTRLKHEVASP